MSIKVDAIESGNKSEMVNKWKEFNANAQGIYTQLKSGNVWDFAAQHSSNGVAASNQ